MDDEKEKAAVVVERARLRAIVEADLAKIRDTVAGMKAGSVEGLRQLLPTVSHYREACYSLEYFEQVCKTWEIA
jgi:hypothetical protein